jgi:hypothetical protein
MPIHPIAELQLKVDVVLQSEPWQQLTDSQRAWVIEFVTSCDAMIATRNAYPNAAEKSLVPMTYEIKRSPRIKAAIEFWKKKADHALMLEIVKAELAAAEIGSAAAANFCNQLQQLLLESLPTEIGRA